MRINVIDEGLVQVEGRLSRNLLCQAIVSSIYIMEDGDDLMIFDPSCGRQVAGLAKSWIVSRREERGSRWKRAWILASHSHLDHANNFIIGDAVDAESVTPLVHERGFKDDQLMNDPVPFLQEMVRIAEPQFSMYTGYPFPYSLLMAPFALLGAVWPAAARKAFAAVGGLPWPRPRYGNQHPAPLKDDDKEEIRLGDQTIRGWRLGPWVVVPTPGHSPCSVSLYSPDRKTILTGDLDWIGNPVFPNGSVKDGRASLRLLLEIARAGLIDRQCSAHERTKEGSAAVAGHLEVRLLQLEALREEILAAQRATGESDTARLAAHLSVSSPLFRMLTLATYPRFVCIPRNMVAVVLAEEGLITERGR